MREAERIRDRLARVEGVHKARVLGERPQRVFVEFDQARLAKLGLTPEAVIGRPGCAEPAAAGRV